MFTFDPAQYREQYQQDQWVHIREGVTPEFHEYLLKFVEQELTSRLLDGFAIQGKKEQALFEFPPEADYPGELFDAVAGTCDLDRDRMVLSERHIQAYEANAAPEPIAHKDRYPSQVSVGLSVTIPEDSRLVLYPYDHREINPFNRAADLNRHLQPADKPEHVLPAAREVELDDRDRDVVMFAGSTTWHLRRRAANAVNVYFKVNDFGCDPLGEDAGSPGVREQTLAVLRSGQLDSGVAEVSRRLDTVSRVHTRHDWSEVLQARVFGEEPVGITESQWATLRALDAATPVATLLAGADGERVRRDIARLAEIGAVDLRAADPR
jgi:hypothetical protein